MTNFPKICFGMVLYNGERYLNDAIKSLLNQTYYDFSIVAVDDCSIDTTEEIMRHYTSIDPRITYIKNRKHLGMIMNWRKAFLEADKKGIDYFAWASDHDLWHPEWLEEHINVLNKFPDVVMAYPFTQAIGSNDKKLSKESTQFETFGLSKMDRIRATCIKIVGAGNMIYGLFRTNVLKRCGVFPYCAMPDRLLIMELSAHGQFKKIKRHLWYRRYQETNDGILQPDYDCIIAQQRLKLFPIGNVPWHSHFPALCQALGLIWHLSLSPPSRNYSNAHLGPYMAYLHLRRKKHLFRKEVRLFTKQMKAKFSLSNTYQRYFCKNFKK